MTYLTTGRISSGGGGGGGGRDGLNGVNGSSAYEIWLDEGNTGSVPDFLMSLIGASGISAYQEWVNAGNAGNTAVFLASLVGTNGRNGISAYQEWLNAGNSGSRSVFLMSLIGNDGASVKGDDGADGISAYQVWLNLGNTGSMQDFITSLMGNDGDTGKDGDAGAGATIAITNVTNSSDVTIREATTGGTLPAWAPLNTISIDKAGFAITSLSITGIISNLSSIIASNSRFLVQYRVVHSSEGKVDVVDGVGLEYLRNSSPSLSSQSQEQIVTFFDVLAGDEIILQARVQAQTFINNRTVGFASSDQLHKLIMIS